MTKHDLLIAASTIWVVVTAVLVTLALLAHGANRVVLPRLYPWFHAALAAIPGDATALSRAEQRGAAVFMGGGACVSCHAGPRLTDGQFHNVGLSPAGRRYGLLPAESTLMVCTSR